MDEPEVPIVDGSHDPVFLRLLAHCLLVRVGGLQSFTFAELEDMQRDYLGMRTIVDFEAKTLTLSIKPVIRSAGPG